MFMNNDKPQNITFVPIFLVQRTLFLHDDQHPPPHTFDLFLLPLPVGSSKSQRLPQIFVENDDVANVHSSQVFQEVYPSASIPGMSGRSDKYACVQSSKNNENMEWWVGSYVHAL